MAKMIIELSSQREARALSLSALASDSISRIQMAEQLEEASSRLLVCAHASEQSLSGTAWLLYAEVLEAIAHLARWDAAIQAAEQDADRYLRAAHRVAETVLTGMPGDATFRATAEVLEAIRSVAEPSQLDECARRAAAIPLPTRLIAAWVPDGPSKPASVSEPEPSPLAVCLVSLDDVPANDVQVVRPNTLYRLGVTARVVDWPDWADTLDLTFASVVPEQSVSFPALIMRRPIRDDDGLYSVSAEGYFELRASLPLGARPLSASLAATLRGPEGRRQDIEVAGYTQFRIRPLDPSRDYLTGATQVDERLFDVFARIHDLGLPTEQFEAFCRYFAILTRCAVQWQAQGLYPQGSHVPESTFQEDLRTRLLMASELGGRVIEGSSLGGGFTDLLHDGIVAELKVEREKAIEVNTAWQYVGQPVQYGSAVNSQVSILCALDMSEKTAPIGVLSNYIDVIEPALHGLNGADYPSRVAVLIINGNLPRPSDWSKPGRRAVPSARQAETT